jgi:hypothetical protein
MGGWDQNGSLGDWLGACGVDLPGSGWGPLAGCCGCGDEPSGSGATELVSYCPTHRCFYYISVKTFSPHCLSCAQKRK